MRHAMGNAALTGGMAIPDSVSGVVWLTGVLTGIDWLSGLVLRSQIECLRSGS